MIKFAKASLRGKGSFPHKAAAEWDSSLPGLKLYSDKPLASTTGCRCLSQKVGESTLCPNSQS